MFIRVREVPRSQSDTKRITKTYSYCHSVLTSCSDIVDHSAHTGLQSGVWPQCHDAPSLVELNIRIYDCSLFNIRCATAHATRSYFFLPALSLCFITWPWLQDATAARRQSWNYVCFFHRNIDLQLRLQVQNRGSLTVLVLSL